MKLTRSHIFVACILGICLLSGMRTSLQNAIGDWRFQRITRQATGDIVVVAIDSHSLESIGVWPWSRKLHAEIIRNLEGAGAKDIVFDVDFSSPSDPVSDEAFLGALKAAGGSVVLPSFKQSSKAGSGGLDHVNRPLPQFQDNAWSAVVNVAIEPDGRVRRYPFGEKLDGQFVPSMGAILAGKHEANDAAFLVDFGIRPKSIPTVSYVDILRGEAEALAKVKDRSVIIGGTALELGDRFSLPNGTVAAGPILQTLAAESILQGRALRATSAAVAIAQVCFITLLMMLTWRRYPALSRAFLLVASAAGAEALCLVIQKNLPLIPDTSVLHLTIAAYLIAIALDEIDFKSLLSRIAENRFQHIAMSLGDGLLCAGPDHRITLWNPGAVAIFGYSSEEVVGLRLDLIWADIDEARKEARFSLSDLRSEILQSPGGQLVELVGRRKNGQTFPLEASFFGWQGTDGFQYGAMLRDISVRQREAEQIRYLAEYDALTGIANRHTLQAYLTKSLHGAQAGSQEHALLVVGLDKFQQINDMLGHSYGDQVLCAVAARLLELVGSSSVVARLSGDEFAVAISGSDVTRSAADLGERILRSFSGCPLSTGIRTQRLKVSIGTAVHPVDGTTAQELLGNAHLALSSAKSLGPANSVFYKNEIREKLERRTTLESELVQAVELKQFELFYQPQVGLSDSQLIGAEALIRWRHPTRGLVSPGEFIPVVNTSAISDKVAAWVLETACAQGAAWERMGCPVRIGVNLSPSQLQSGDLTAAVKTALANAGLSASLLELEVTEDILLADAERVLQVFQEIQDLGVRIVFDDFGTGYASLSYLKKFPLDGLKIDRSFVMELKANSEDGAIVSSTISLSKQLGLSVIAEGIESGATANLLIAMGCDEGQGYHFGRPMPASDFEHLLCSRVGLRTKVHSVAAA